MAAFGLSASIFTMLLYLVLYLQDILGYSPLGTGVRVMFLSGSHPGQRHGGRPADVGRCRSGCSSGRG